MEVKGKPHLDASLLPIYQEYRAVEGNEDISLWTYVNMRADLDLAIAFSKLYWPDFVEIEGYVFLAETYNHTLFQLWKHDPKIERHEIEAFCNTVRIRDRFLNSSEILERPTSNLFSDALLDYFAQVLMKCWRHALTEVFPERKFVFESWRDNEGLGGVSPEITFYQA